MRFLFLLLVVLGLSQPAFASSLRFGFINPSFGGNPFNSAHLLALAESQRVFVNDSDEQEDPFSSVLAQIQGNIAAQSINNLIDNVASGDTSSEPVELPNGVVIQAVPSGNSGASIVVTDPNTGGTTLVDVSNLVGTAQ